MVSRRQQRREKQRLGRELVEQAAQRHNGHERDTFSEEVERMYWEDVDAGMFEDFKLCDDFWDVPYDIDDLFDDWYEDDPVPSPKPGTHCQDAQGGFWLALDTGVMANLLTGVTRQVWQIDGLDLA